VSRASDSARAAVAAAGGSVTTVHYNRLSLRALLKPERFAAAPGMPPVLPRPAAPPPRLRGRVDAIGGLPAGAPHTPIPGMPAAAQAAQA
jgi:large subunit ribosomal protein L15